MSFEKIDRYIEENLPNTIEEFRKFVAQPSVSAQRFGIDDCAEMVTKMLHRRGFSAEKITVNNGHPIVFGEAKGRSDKTILLYLHYDVQPPEPLELWESPPWELTRRNGSLYGRGAQDDKGNMMTRLAALDALMAVNGELPCNIKFVIEGEEEIGSPSIKDFVAQNKDRLESDACIWEFGGVNAAGIPQLYLGLRGIVFVNLKVKTASRDVHSGLGGSIIHNAAWRMIGALTSIKNPETGEVYIPGFYDGIVEPSELDKALIEKLPDDSAEIKEMYGLKGFLRGMEGGPELRTAKVFEPTCNICGLTSGYQGDGGKTIVPAEATAKIDFRLVPNQDPDKIVANLRKHLDDNGYDDVEISVLSGYAPAKVAPDDPFVKVTIDTAQDVYGHETLVEPIMGGSGPMSWFLDHLDMPIITAGAGYPGARIHAPNEHVVVDLFEKAIKHTARIIQTYAGLE